MSDCDSLTLGELRNELRRLEDVIIFALLCRGQYGLKQHIYIDNEKENTEKSSLLDKLLHDTELVHAKYGRYQCPHELPFSSSDEIKSLLIQQETPSDLLPGEKVNFNEKLKKVYQETILPLVCASSKKRLCVSNEKKKIQEKDNGSCCLCDIEVLQALSKRIHYGRYVAKVKFINDKDKYKALVENNDSNGILHLLTDASVEKRNLHRILLKAELFCRSVDHEVDQGQDHCWKMEPKTLVEIFEKVIIPLTKEVEVAYIFETNQKIKVPEKMTRKLFSAQDIIIAPSILSADFSILKDDCSTVLEGGADWLHVDIMDGHFVKNLSLGVPVFKSLARSLPDVFYDVHLMTSEPGNWITPFANAGASQITYHWETAKSEDDAEALISKIREAGCLAGISVKPKTVLSEKVLSFLTSQPVNTLLIMTVEPGFGGQSFMEDMLPKFTEARKHCPDLILEADGGVTTQNSSMILKSGGNALVAGTSVFGASDRVSAIHTMRQKS